MIEIFPIKDLDATVSVPGSKYVANRALIAAALAGGTSIIKNIPDNDDVNAALEALEHFGVKIEKEQDAVKITGIDGKPNVPDEIDVKESGTLLRFIAGFAALADGKTRITGSSRIQERPIADLLKSLQDLGIKSESDKPPVVIHGGTFKGGQTKIKGSVSSQYISSLLLISPYADKDVEILVEDLVSKNYVDMTINVMKEFGVSIEREGYSRFFVKSGQKYQSKEYNIPADCSSANYFLAAAAIVPGKVTVKGLETASNQESGFPDILEKMGCTIKRDNGNVSVKGPEKLIGIEADMSSMPDSVQTLTVVSLFSNGATKIRNIGNLKFKESDRINDTAEELRKLEANVTIKDNELIIKPAKLNPATIDPHNDHRMAMSFALAGLKMGIKIENPECVSKSFPQYWGKLRELGVEIKNA